MKKIMILVALCCIALSTAAQQVDVQGLFTSNRKLFTKKSNTVQRFSSDWMKTDTGTVSYSNSYDATIASKNEKVFVQFFGRHGFRVGTKENVLEVYYSSFYFYCYILTRGTEGIFFIDEQGGGGYVVPDTSGAVYLDYWGNPPGFSFEEEPLKFFRFMSREEMDKFNKIVSKFVQECKVIGQKNKLQKLRAVSQPPIDF